MNKTYSEKLKDPRWQQRRLEIMERDGFACVVCGDNETELHIHHFYYIRGKDPWDYPDHALWCVCKVCHLSLENEKSLLLRNLSEWNPKNIRIDLLANLVEILGRGNNPRGALQMLASIAMEADLGTNGARVFHAILDGLKNALAILGETNNGEEIHRD